MRRLLILFSTMLALALAFWFMLPAPLTSPNVTGSASALAPSQSTSVAMLPLIMDCEGQGAGCGAPPPTTQATATATRTATATATATSTPTEIATGQNYNILVGPGYTDVSPKQLVRTSGNRLYIGVSNCDQYPCTDVAQKLRMYRADSTGVPTGFSLVDASHAPTGVSQWAIAIDGSNTIHVVWNDSATNGGNLVNLRYTTFSTATDTWSGAVETIDTPLDVAQDGGGQGMQ